MKFISKIFLKLAGWKLNYASSNDLKRCVMIAAPHTSNWDFVFARAAFFVMDVDMKFMVKKELIRFPLGSLMMKLGAIPVNRSVKGNLVQHCIDLFGKHKELVIMIPPEGTRGKVEKWKTGFYHTAVGANVPIACGYLDFKKKEAGIGPIFKPSGNIEDDFKVLRDFYRNITPEHPSLFNPENIRP